MAFLAAHMDKIMLVLGTLVGVYASTYFINMLQLESYQANMYVKWLRRNILRDWFPTILIFVICMLLEIALPILVNNLDIENNQIYFVGLLSIRVIYLGLMGYVGWIWHQQPLKKPLVYTGRVKRLIAAVAILIAVLYIWPITAKVYYSQTTLHVIGYAFTYLPALVLPLLVLLGHFLTYPIEEGIKRYYLNDAKRKLMARTDIIKIGITGSYGKTSTKYALGTLLNEKYNTLITPHSYNTPMGVTRVIREQLLPEHEVFVAEMGARYVGDIDELCDLVHPTIGLLTSVDKQHLETFGSFEQIANTKFELIANLPAEGAAFFNADNETCLALKERKVAVQDRFLYGIDSPEPLYMRAVDIGVGSEGSYFTLKAENGESIACRTRLLGQHNILNLVGCAAIAHYMGLTLKQIAAGIRKVEPVEHRLQLIPGTVTVIDDAFNANPAGAKAAMDVMRLFSGRRIVVTPGMVELGEEEDAQNEAFGRVMASSTDIAILIGKKRAEAIMRGLEAAGFPQEAIVIVPTLDQATEELAKLTKPGDVVLFENDLPDNYNE